MMRPCLDCGTPSPKTRCPEHARAAENRRHNRLYDEPRWRRLSRKVKQRHIRRHGYMCPGYEREAHLAVTLHADHITPVAHGGAPFDESNVQVLCGECNDRKGSRLVE